MRKTLLSVICSIALLVIPAVAALAQGTESYPNYPRPVSELKNDLGLIGADLFFIPAGRSPFGKWIDIHPATPTVSRTYTIPDVGANASFLMSTGTQTLTGPLTLTGLNSITHSSSGMKIYNPAGTFYVTVTPSAESANRVLTIPLLGAADTIMTLGTAQTVTGIKTMSGANLITMASTGCAIQNPAGTFTVSLTPSAEVASRILTIPLLGGADTIVTLGTVQIITGVKTFNAIPILPALTVTRANLQDNAQLCWLTANLSPVTGNCANSTVYRQSLRFGRAGTVKAVYYGTHVDPTSGTNTIKVLKAATNGNTMLNAASVSLNGATADVTQTATLTGTGADLAVTAGQLVYCEYSAGTQGSAAQDVFVTVEFEPTAF